VSTELNEFDIEIPLRDPQYTQLCIATLLRNIDMSGRVVEALSRDLYGTSIKLSELVEKVQGVFRISFGDVTAVAHSQSSLQLTLLIPSLIFACCSDPETATRAINIYASGNVHSLNPVVLTRDVAEMDDELWRVQHFNENPSCRGLIHAHLHNLANLVMLLVYFVEALTLALSRCGNSTHLHVFFAFSDALLVYQHDRDLVRAHVGCNDAGENLRAFSTAKTLPCTQI
jgi:hypothetical protein